MHHQTAMSAHKWNVMQFNCNKSQLATAEIEGHFAANQLDLALVQEPQLTDNPAMGCRVKKIQGTIAIQASNSFKRPGARAAIYIRSDIGKAIKLIVLEQFSNRDMVTIQVELLQNEVMTKMLISSTYCPSLDAEGNRIADPTNGKLREVVSFANSKRIPIIIGMDANAHNPSWGGNKTDSRGILLEEFCLLEGHLKILNRRGEATYERLGINAAISSIDLTICSEHIESYLQDWKTLDGFRGSDHKPIMLTLQASRPDAGRTKVKSSTNWKNYANIVGKNLLELESVFSRCTSTEGLDLAAATFGKALRSAYEVCTKSRVVKCNFKREWYSKSLENQKKKINRIHSKLKRARQLGNETLSQVAYIEYKAERSSYKKLCSKQKFAKWKQMAQDLEEIKDSARLQKILEKRASSNLGSVRRSDGSYTQSIEETQEELMNTHLPGCVRLEDQVTASSNRLSASEIADIIHTSNVICHNNPERHRNQPAANAEASMAMDKEIDEMTSDGNIEWAIASFKPNKAPGPDGVTPNMLKKAGEAVVAPLKKMFACSARLGHIPEEWSAAAITFIPKAGKPSYDDTSAYRPISLMSFILKTMEKLIDQKIRKTDCLDEKLHKNQHAYREGKGTATALDEAATIIENCLEKGGKALAVYLDIKGAFDQTAYTTTTSSLAELGVKDWTVKWVKSLLSNRKIQPANKDSCRRYRPVMGLPQGGCSSPLGWIVCANSLVTRLTEAGFDTIAYADDFKIIAKKAKNDIDHLSRHITRALRIVSEWCTTTGLSVNPNKVGLVQFYRGKLPVSNISNIVFEGVRLTPTENVKFLGVYFDRELNWDYHIQQAVEKGRRTTMVMAQYLRFSWGPSPRAAMLLVNQVVTPRVLYACGIWWHRARLDKHAKKLDKLQRLMIRMATGVFHTTPTADILRILDVESLTLKAKKMALDESLRLTELGGRRAADSKKGHRCIDILLREIADARRNSDSIQRTWNTQRKYRVIVNERTRWQDGLETDRYTDVWFSDGSKREELVGVGLCDSLGQTEIALKISGHATIMQAETTGIRLCTEQFESSSFGKRILILSDSQAALKALDNPVIRSETVRICANALNKLAANNTVVLGWVPGHSQHAGNEKADRLANEGAARPTTDLGVPEASSSRSGKIASWLTREKKEEWLKKRPDNGLYAKTLIEASRRGKHKNIINKSRAQIRARMGILTGHARTAKYLLRAKAEGNGMCRFCSLSSESIEHLIRDCPRLTHIREDVMGANILSYDQLKTADLERLIKFSKEAGFYDMLACDIKTNN